MPSLMVKILIIKIKSASGSIGFTVDQRMPGVILARISKRITMPARIAIETGSLIMNIAAR